MTKDEVKILFFSLIVLLCSLSLSQASSDEESVQDVNSSERVTNKETQQKQAGSSSNQQKSDSGFVFNQDLALKQLDIIYNYKPKIDCTRDGLIEVERSGTNKTRIKTYLKKCDEVFEQWIKDKIEQIQRSGLFVERWLRAISNFIYETDDAIELILSENFDPREANFGKKLRASWRYWSTEEDLPAESLRRAYFNGGGICVSFSLAPFDKIEPYFDYIMQNISKNQFVEYFHDKKLRHSSAPSGLILYLHQKVCHKFKNTPTNIRGEKETEVFHLKSPNYGERRKALATLVNMLYNQTEFKCDDETLGQFEYAHKLLDTLKGDFLFEEIKQSISSLTDKFASDCLDMFGAEDSDDYELLYPVDDSMQQLLRDMRRQISGLILNFDLNQVQSINQIIDVRSEKSKFKAHFFEHIRNLINQESNPKLVELFINLTTKKLSLFREAIYERRQSEFKTIEFLIYLLSIKGYRPNISHPLLEFFLLYRIVENCKMEPIDF